MFVDELRGWDWHAFPLDARDQLCLFGVLAAAEGRHARAARLLAAGTVVVGRPGEFAWPDVRVDAEDASTRARAALGDAAFEAAAAEGRAMTLKEAVAEALAADPSAASRLPREERGRVSWIRAYRPNRRV